MDQHVVMYILEYDVDMLDSNDEVTIDNITDAILLDYLKQRISTETSLIDFKILFKEVRYDLTIEDAKSRVYSLILAVEKALINNGCADHKDNTTFMKDLIKHITALIKPHSVAEVIQSRMRYADGTSLKLLAETAIPVIEVQDQLYIKDKRNNEQRKRTDKPFKSSFQNKAEKPSIPSASSTASSSTSSKERKALVCIHCNGSHHIRDCPTATPEKKKELLKSFWDKL